MNRRFPHIAQGFFLTDLEGVIHSRFTPQPFPKFLTFYYGVGKQKTNQFFPFVVMKPTHRFGFACSVPGQRRTCFSHICST